MTRLVRRCKPLSPVAFAFAFTCAFVCAFACTTAAAQDYEREARWAEQTLQGLVVGDAVWLQQRDGHRFLALYTPAAQARGAVVIAHGRGWSPDHELYGALRTKLAEAGYSTLSIQMPVLSGTAKVGDYLPTFPDASERFALANAWLRGQGFRKLAIVSHSLGATMANYYLIHNDSGSASATDRANANANASNPDSPKVDAWVFISIINGLEDMFRIHVPVLDVFGSNDWDVTRVGAGERLKQLSANPGSEQVVVQGAEHFFETQQDQLTKLIAAFLDRTLQPPRGAASR